MEISNKVNDFLKAPEEIAEIKKGIKKFFIVTIVIAIIAFIVFAIMGEIRFMWIIVVFAIPYFILFVVMYLSRLLNYMMFVRKVHSQGLDSKIEN